MQVSKIVYRSNYSCHNTETALIAQNNALDGVINVSRIPLGRPHIAIVIIELS